jgi:hypothetical protein
LIDGRVSPRILIISILLTFATALSVGRDPAEPARALNEALIVARVDPDTPISPIRRHLR